MLEVLSTVEDDLVVRVEVDAGRLQEDVDGRGDCSIYRFVGLDRVETLTTGGMQNLPPCV